MLKAFQNRNILSDDLTNESYRNYTHSVRNKINIKAPFTIPERITEGLSFQGVFMAEFLLFILLRTE